MAGGSTRLSALALVFLLRLSTNSSLLFSEDKPEEETSLSPEWVKFEVKRDVYFDAVGTLDDGLVDEEREALARSPFGTYDANGLNLARPVPADLLEGPLVYIEGEMLDDSLDASVLSNRVKVGI